MMLRIVVAFLLLGALSGAHAQTGVGAQPDDSDLSWMDDDPVVATLDSLWSLRLFKDDKFTTDRNLLNIYKFPYDSVPQWTDSVYAARFAEMDRNSPFDFRYNEPVEKYMKLYVNRRRSYAQKLLGLSEVYYPLFEEMLDRYDLPYELKHLAIVESGLNPTAKSRAGAVGLWQFMYKTGKMLGLESSNYMDDRRDPIQATEAACQYLRYLYSLYHDWDLALAAYNAGPGNVNKAIRRAGGMPINYWQVRPYLPRETQSYVPAFYGVVYFMTYPQEHNLYPRQPDIRYFDYDTVQVKQGVSFTQISETLDLEYELVEFLNPVYKEGVIPHPPVGGSMTLYLPTDKIGDFVTNESYIYAYGDSVKPLAESKVVKVKQYHVVQEGEYLSKVARKYSCSIEELRIWNNLRSSSVVPGQKLIVYVPDPKQPTPEPASTETTQKTTSTTDSGTNTGNTKYRYHVVEKGDTLWGIANRYDGLTLEKIRALNQNLDETGLKTGQKIKIGVKG